MPNNVVNDSSVVAGSRTITINAVAYDCTNWSWDEDTLDIERVGPTGRLTGYKGVDRNKQVATATCQIPTTSSALPPKFVTFTTLDVDGNSVTCFITKRGVAESNGGETTVPITVRKAIGSIVVS